MVIASPVGALRRLLPLGAVVAVAGLVLIGVSRSSGVIDLSSAPRPDLVRAIDRHPLHRAVRCGKLTIAALEATLSLYREPTKALRDIPTLAMLTAPVAEIEQRAVAMAADLRGDHVSGTREHTLLGPDWDLRVERTESTVGGGAFATARIPSVAITVTGDITALEQRLRQHALPVVTVTREGRLWLDLRSVPAAQDAALTQRLRKAIAG